MRFLHIASFVYRKYILKNFGPLYVSVCVAILKIKIISPWVINANMIIGGVGFNIILYGSD